MQTVRILISVEVEADALTDAYDNDLTPLFTVGTDKANDLIDTLAARLSEFYPGEDGYVVGTNVVAVAVDSDAPALTAADLRGIYEVGVEGVI